MLDDQGEAFILLSIALTDDTVSLQIGRSFFEILLAHFQCARVDVLGLLSISCRVLVLCCVLC
jgi:hypothetical protein